MKVKAKNLSDKDRITTLDALYTAAGTVRGRSAMKFFLRDLLTESERIMLGRRILIAQKIISGETYDVIAADMKVGHDTIQRVHRWLRDQLPGYEKAIRGMETEYGKRRNKSEMKNIWTQLRRRYPLHFLLFNIFDDPVKSRRK